MTPRSRRVIGCVWLGLLGSAVLISGADAWVRTSQVEEKAYGCDSFGYLNMAKEIRGGVARRELPRFTLESAHTRLLIDHFRAMDTPLAAWDELVAPHAHHYFPFTRTVGVQYPPGAGAALACFPEDRAVLGLNRVNIICLVCIGLLSLIVAARNDRLLAAGSAILAIHVGLDMIGWIGSLSYSINAVLLPLLFAIIALMLATEWRSPQSHGARAFAIACFAGSWFGFAILVRVSSVLLLPGILLMIATARSHVRTILVGFILATLLVGVIPLLIYQQMSTGAWYLATYNVDDRSPPNVAVLQANLNYYFGNGIGNQYNWALGVVLLGFVGAAFLARSVRRGTDGPGPWRFLWSALVIWGASAAYFISHRVTVPYYQIPAVFAAIATLALGQLSIRAGAAAGEAKLTPFRGLLLAAALAPGLVAIERAAHVAMRLEFVSPVPAGRVEIPEELTAPNAWIYADLLSGALWYYGKVPAYKVAHSDPQTRAIVYRFVAARGDTQFMICDSPTMWDLLDEAIEGGAKAERRGEIDGRPYYLLRWR